MSGGCNPKLLKSGACCGSVGVWAAADGVELGLGGFLEAQLCAASSNLQNSTFRVRPRTGLLHVLGALCCA